MDNTLYRSYLRLCLFVFENISGVQLKLFGDIEQMKSESESVLVLANHQSNVDWAVMVMLAARQGKLGSDAGFRVMVKQAIHYVPLFGWYIFQVNNFVFHGYIYVRRFGDFVGGPVLRQLKWLDSLDEKFWLLVFPEGTRYSRMKMDKIEASREFCRRVDHVFMNENRNL
uniref:PlsC domain-containing protein n=1 Tax=Heterorhabditis bacteriophora TaxID=37862 RepID=A0A1I7XHP3_HETBA